jgi:hypothetical protein
MNVSENMISCMNEKLYIYILVKVIHVSILELRFLLVPALEALNHNWLDDRLVGVNHICQKSQVLLLLGE